MICGGGSGRDSPPKTTDPTTVRVLGRPPRSSPFLRTIERMRLDEHKLEALRHWGNALQQAGTDEYAAAGRAILMLIDEVEQLQTELRYATEVRSAAVWRASGESVNDMSETPVAATLHERLHRALGRQPPSSPRGLEPAEAAESETEAPSSQTWIESLRQRK